MINLVIAFDNQDSKLGRYFEDCRNDILSLLDEQNHLVKSILRMASNQCNEAYIDVVVSQLNPNPFIFVAYTHGTDDGLKCNGTSFVSVDNCHYFANTLFYSTACLIGRKLASELIAKGCKTFIGFKDKSEVFECASYRQTFIECDNYALKMFLISDSTIGKAFDSMKVHYTSKIDRLMELGEDIFYIAALRENRDALVCSGDRNLKKEDLFVLT